MKSPTPTLRPKVKRRLTHPKVRSRKAGGPHPQPRPGSISFSSPHLGQNNVCGLLRFHGCVCPTLHSPGKLCRGITDSGLLRHLSSASATLRALRAGGINIVAYRPGPGGRPVPRRPSCLCQRKSTRLLGTQAPGGKAVWSCETRGGASSSFSLSTKSLKDTLYAAGFCCLAHAPSSEPHCHPESAFGRWVRAPPSPGPRLYPRC